MESNLKSAGSPLGLTRWAVAWVVLGACLFFAWLASYAFGTYYLTDTGLDRLREQADGLIMASVAGTGGVAGFRALTEKRVLSPWLLVGLVLPVIAALNHLGVIR